MKLRLTRQAADQLTAIADFIRQRNPMAAIGVRAAIMASLSNLTAFPDLGRKQATPGVRKLVTRRYSYIVYYKVDAKAGEVVVVVSIRHYARKRLHKNA
jgi:plasmid stabilization system protein ParE